MASFHSLFSSPCEISGPILVPHNIFVARGEEENALMHFEPSKIREIGPDWHVWLLDLGLLYFCQKIKGFSGLFWHRNYFRGAMCNGPCRKGRLSY